MVSLRLGLGELEQAARFSVMRGYVGGHWRPTKASQVRRRRHHLEKELTTPSFLRKYFRCNSFAKTSRYLEIAFLFHMHLSW